LSYEDAAQLGKCKPGGHKKYNIINDSIEKSFKKNLIKTIEYFSFNCFFVVCIKF